MPDDSHIIVRMPDAIAASDIHQGFARLAPCQSLLPLIALSFGGRPKRTPRSFAIPGGTPTSTTVGDQRPEVATFTCTSRLTTDAMKLAAIQG